MQTSIIELIPEIGKVRLELPLIQWVKSIEADKKVQDELLFLLKVYRLTNDCYDERFKGGEKETILSQYLRKMDDYSMFCEDNTYVVAMNDIVKANILLRRGQVKADSFFDPTDDYRQACVILDQCRNQKEPELLDFLQFLIQLNLGKFFRNMGLYSHRSDYYRRSLDEFMNLLAKLADSVTQGPKEPWKDFIWLEAAMNLSRIELYLYRLRDAKIHLWIIYQKTQKIFEGSKKIEAIFAIDKGKEQGKDIIQSIKIGKILCDSQNSDLADIKSNLEIKAGYATQALIQMGIAFRKTRDYIIAREIFATILCENLKNNDPMGINVDALNNYAVCLRKCGFYINNPTQPDKKFIEYLELNKPNEHMKFDWVHDDVKKLYSAIISCILQGKNTKKEIKAEYNKSQTKKGIDHRMKERTFKNRFATIEYIRSLHRGMNDSDCQIDEIGELFDELLKNNPRDRELLLQKGIFLQMSGKIKDSQTIFSNLFSEDKRIARGSIGLKAYYGMGCNLLSEKRYYEAKKHFIKIKNEISSNLEGPDNSRQHFEVACINDLPNIDVLSEMDYAWCLMNIGEYGDAKEIYSDILTQYSCKIARLGLHNEMKIRNNLIECCLQILAGYYQTCEKNDRIIRIRRIIEDNLMSIKHREPLNGTALKHNGYYNLLCGMYAEANEQKSKNFSDALKRFEEAAVQLHNDVFVHSGWVSAAYARWQNEKTNSKVIDQVKKRLHYISGPYSIRSCAKLAEMLYSLDPQLAWDTEDKALLRCLARIQLSDGEEGYALFQELKENEYFSISNPVDRGKLLIFLFQIYKNILDIKECCRYHPYSDNLPVQYRSIKRLKSYLEDGKDKSGRFTLWNIAYMNDYFEGESFNTMLRQAADSDCREIAEYYTNSSKVDIGDNLISSAEKNIYISSLSLKKDVIPMWIAYADTGNGCAITYSEEFLNHGYRKDLVTDVACYSDAEYPLYKVYYMHPKTMGINENDGTLKAINSSLRTILQLLKDLKSNLVDMVHQNGYGRNLAYVIDEFVRSCFNEVRFLIKDSEYASEEEIRMIHYSKEGKLSVEEDKIPRFYIEREGEVLIEEVMLGPKIDTFQQNEISTWLNKTGKVKRVTHSERHYR